MMFPILIDKHSIKAGQQLATEVVGNGLPFLGEPYNYSVALNSAEMWFYHISAPPLKNDIFPPFSLYFNYNLWYTIGYISMTINY